MKNKGKEERRLNEAQAQKRAVSFCIKFQILITFYVIDLFQQDKHKELIWYSS